jgi:hypothetical protein
MAVTELEQMILDQAEAIKRRESLVDGDAEVTDDMIRLAEEGGTEQHVEMLRARQEGRSPRHFVPNPVGTFGAAVPPSEVRDAATHQPMGPVKQPSQSDVDGLAEDDPTAPVRESDPDVGSYDEWSKGDLVDEAKVRELPSSGNKEELAARLREDDAQYQAMTTPQAVDGDDTPPQ